MCVTYFRPLHYILYSSLLHWRLTIFGSRFYTLPDKCIIQVISNVSHTVLILVCREIKTSLQAYTFEAQNKVYRLRYLCYEILYQLLESAFNLINNEKCIMYYHVKKEVVIFQGLALGRVLDGIKQMHCSAFNSIRRINSLHRC